MTLSVEDSIQYGILVTSLPDMDPSAFAKVKVTVLQKIIDDAQDPLSEVSALKVHLINQERSMKAKELVIDRLEGYILKLERKIEKLGARLGKKKVPHAELVNPTPEMKIYAMLRPLVKKAA